MDTYTTNFEVPLIQQTTAHFKECANKWKNEHSCDKYIDLVKFALDLEEKNADAFLMEQSKVKMSEIVLTECIEKQAESLADNIDTGCTPMFDND